MTAASVSTASPPTERAKGRGLLWLGIGLCLLGIALQAVQFGVVKALFVPWYSPVLATLGALLLVCSVVRRRTVTRTIALVLVAALAGFQWYFLGSMMKLPDYAGPAQAGRKMPAFTTATADGRPFTEKDLQGGQYNVLVFNRGRW